MNGRRVCASLACFLLGTVCCFAEATNRVPDQVVSRLRVGPFYESQTARDGGRYWALRPFYSRVSDPPAHTTVTDVVWPLSTFHSLYNDRWWRVVLAYGSDLDVTRDDSAWSFALLPLYFQGRTRQGADYQALFPIYGHIPHLLLVDDVSFELFPVHLDYKVNGVEREYYLWPIFSHMGEDPNAKRTGFFPLYGKTDRKTETNSYVLWPFWTESVYFGDRNPGSSQMLFPIYATVDREREKQWMAVPPFVSHAKTDSADRWRAPWPLVETLDSKEQTKRSFWPFYGYMSRGDEYRWYAVWPLIESFSLSSKARRTERYRFFPFYVDETVFAIDASGQEHVKETYTRVWPFYAQESDATGSRLRVLGLSLIRFSGGIERNWAPFWTLYERDENAAGAVKHDLLWGLFQWHTGTQKETTP